MAREVSPIVRMEKAAVKSAKGGGPAVSVAAIERETLMLFWNEDSDEFHYRLGDQDLTRETAEAFLTDVERRTGAEYRF